MQTHDESGHQQNPVSGNPEKDRGHEAGNLPAGGIGAQDPEGIPDGSGTDAQGSGSDQGRESGSETFDAG